tara:strand:- start:1266 stop:2054 length:789 start_codon:yes stop_codon:yes gene_type:complete
MTNEEYHAAPGLNKSKLTMMMDDPALVRWIENCPVDDEKVKTLDFGSAFHTAVLEPELFDDQYAVEPDVNKRTNAGKAELAEFQQANGHKTIISAAEYKKIKLMAGSAIAHPAISALIRAKTGTEVSIFAEDPATGLLVKCRNDLEAEINGLKFVCDLKTIDKLDMIPRAIHEYHYHVQEAHYKEVYRLEHGAYPDHFLFIFCAKTIECGRYPVRLVELDYDTQEVGRQKWETAMSDYAHYEVNDNWPGVCVAGLPKWAYRR